MDNYRKIFKNGLWENNQAFVALLGLCPLLAVSNTVINGLALGLATTLTLILSNAIVSLIRHQVGNEIRLPVFVLIIASIVTAIELTMNAYFFELYLILGIFIPLIVTNCSIIGRAEAFASKNPIGASCIDGLGMGLGFTSALVILGAMREILGSGTLFANAHLIFGAAAKDMTITVIGNYEGFLLAILPPGAFIGLGLLIALKNVLDKRLAKPAFQTVNLSLDAKKA
ncbi:MAG: electron transport complex subunit E [Cycloclasticus sp.]|jgi:electron transport complex protein RnfE|nr:electron transport complex subunit E [Cycloclasticus sp.]|tara:strand:- start:119035 stop:119718 length:684 start_codon:yes stop_codon:yes gene_type:complete